MKQLITHRISLNVFDHDIFGAVICDFQIDESVFPIVLQKIPKTSFLNLDGDSFVLAAIQDSRKMPCTPYATCGLLYRKPPVFELQV